MDRIVVIEMAARRLGITTLSNVRVGEGYQEPSVEEDMEDINVGIFACQAQPCPIEA